MEAQEALWITKALDGDDSAFGQLVELYQRPVFSLCYRMLGNSKAAEDAAQESFLRAYTHIKRYDPKRSFATWLLSIASHYCIDQMRKRRLDTVSTDALPAEIVADHNAPNPEREFRSREKEAMIQKLLNDLKPTDRAAIVLRYWHQYSEVEIAESLNLSVGAVKSRLFRARQALANGMTAEEATLPVRERRPDESPAL
ncbi:sigma-70 family RNA polymerase sigma factor [Chloroflexota bacterium]|nr:sigma-70 family RNA polymerase sigma factor [Chloroflexota bacterium]